MAVRDSATRRAVPAAIQAAIERGLVTEEQLRELIEIEAEWIDLSFDEAVRRGPQGTLPRNELGADLEFLVRELLRQETRVVILSEAKNLVVISTKFFASLRMTKGMVTQLLIGSI